MSSGTFVRMPRIGIAAQCRERLALAQLSRVSPHGDQLGEQRIVVNATSEPSITPAIDANAGHRRFAIEQQRPGLRQKVLSCRILRVDAHSMACPRCDSASCVHGSGSPAATRDLRANQVDAGHLLR